jgi:hypothetical protein
MVLTSGVTPLAEDVAADVAAAVLQHQGANGAEAAKIEQVEAGGAEEAGRVRLAEGAAQRGQVVQRVADRDVAGFEEFLAADRGDRNGDSRLGRRMREPVTVFDFLSVEQGAFSEPLAS